MASHLSTEYILQLYNRVEYHALVTNATVASEQRSSKAMLDKSQCCTASCIAPILLVFRSDLADSLALQSPPARSEQESTQKGAWLVSGLLQSQTGEFICRRCKQIVPSPLFFYVSRLSKPAAFFSRNVCVFQLNLPACFFGLVCFVCLPGELETGNTGNRSSLKRYALEGR